MVYYCALIKVKIKLSKYILLTDPNKCFLLQYRGTIDPLPGFGTQCFDFIFLNELTASELLDLPVQVTDVPHCHTHRESWPNTLFTHFSSHGPIFSPPPYAMEHTVSSSRLDRAQ